MNIVTNFLLSGLCKRTTGPDLPTDSLGAIKFITMKAFPSACQDYNCIYESVCVYVCVCVRVCVCAIIISE